MPSDRHDAEAAADHCDRPLPSKELTTRGVPMVPMGAACTDLRLYIRIVHIYLYIHISENTLYMQIYAYRSQLVPIINRQLTIISSHHQPLLNLY